MSGILTDLLRVIFAGLVAFVVMLLMPFYYLALFTLGLASSIFLIIALFCGVGYLFQPTMHNLLNTLGFLGYSAAAFLVIFAIYYIPGRIKDRNAVRRQQHQALDRISGLRLASDAPFNESGRG